MPMRRPAISDADIKDPVRLRQVLERIDRNTYDLLNQIGAINESLSRKISAGQLSSAERAAINSLLIGSVDNPIPTQKASIPTVSTLPPTATASDGDVVQLTTDSLIYRFNGSTLAWSSITSANVVTTNTVQNIGPGAAKTFKDLATFDKATGAILIKPASAPAAGTHLFELEDNLGGTLAFMLEDGGIWSMLALGVFNTNSAACRIYNLYEELTLSTVGVATDTAANLLLDGLILGVVGYVTQTISGGGVTAFSVGDAAQADRFTSLSGGLPAGNKTIGVRQWRGSVGTDAAGPAQVGSAKIRVTTDATPTQGKIRLVSFIMLIEPPTS